MSEVDTDQERPASRNLQGLRPAFKFLLPYKKQVLFASLALIVTAAATLMLGQGIRLVVDEGFASGESQFLSESLMLFGGFVCVLTIGTFIRFYFVSWVGERVSADIREAVFAHLISIHPAFFEQNLPSEIQSRITTDTTLLQTVIGSSVSIALRNILMFFGGVIFLFITSIKLSLIVLASVPLVVLPLIVFGRRVRSLSRSSQDRLADVGSYAGESLRHIKVVQAFNHQQADRTAFAERVASAFDVAVIRIRHRAVLVAIVMLVVFGAVATMLWVGGQDVLAGNISGGELGAFIFYAFIVAGSVGAISEVITDLQRAAGATERLVELLESPSEIASPDSPIPLPDAGLAGLKLEHVGFSYPTRPDVQVLDDVNIEIAAGEMVAIVGPSGAGKSTLFDLVQRFYDPNEGRVLVSKASQLLDVTTLELTELRQQIGFVPQDSVLFAGSVLDNLRYARAEAVQADIEAALQQASAADFVNRLPQGLDTKIGESGVGLSGGQRQRLAIARALVARPGILLLDEATSALDAESEESIRNTIEELKGAMTILVIAHRLSTVRQADRIIVLDQGRVVGSGRHEDLLQSNDLYARFARVQFAA